MVYLKKLQNRQERFKAEGSITVFLALTLVLILSFLFSMVEMARVSGLSALAKQKTVLQAESMQGAYNRELWEHYGLLFLDMSYGSGEPDARLIEECMMEEADREGKEQHFYQMALQDAEIEAYKLATDKQGAELKQQACNAIKAKGIKERIETLEGQIEDWQALEQKSSSLEEKWEEAIAAEEEAEGYKGIEKEEDSRYTESECNQTKPVIQEQLPKNPIGYVTQLKTTSLLAMVLEQPLVLSGKAIDTENALYNRELFCGNLESKQEKNVDKMCFVQYLNQYFFCRTNIWEQGHALDYELEYCIAGKNTDAGNLEEVVKQLLQIRESANFVTIMQDIQKQSLAMEMAVGMVGFTGLPLLIKAVQIGILLAWSYIESVTDVRCLLSGGKVPLIKDGTQWKSNLFQIEESLKGESTTGQQGMDYQEYLQILLFLTEEETLTNRVMDVMERNIRLFSGNEAVGMDAMVSVFYVRFTYRASPLFFNVVPIMRKIDGNYQFVENGKFAY